MVEKDLSYKIVGILYNIHKELGRYCKERQYGDKFEVLLKEQNMSYRREVPISVVGRKSNFADFCIADRILVEFKAKQIITREDYFQMQRYLVLHNKELGILVNFRQRILRPKRVLNSQFTN